MNVEILIVGDEILLGQTLDTNSNFLAKQLAALGQPAHAVTVLPDERDPLLGAFRRAYHGSDVVLICGGLGPTHDDKTKDTLAGFFNLPIVFRNDILEQVREVYRKRQLAFIETSREQAEFPEGATPMPNRLGTAPGIWIEREGRIYAAMPGVPAEMKAMMRDFVLPRLKKKAADRETTRFRSIHTFGIKEAGLYEKLDNRDEIERDAALAFLPSYRGVRLRLTVKAKNAEEALYRLDRADALVREKIGAYVIGAGEQFSIEQAVGHTLKGRGWKLAVAESCTGGLLAKRITDVSGSSAWFERGFITYSNEAKQEQLAVAGELLANHGAVSAEVARAMAEGALEHSRANAALSITGVAGPTGGTEEKPVGLVYIGYADASTVTHRRHLFGEDREVNRERSVTAALLLVLDRLRPAAEEREPQLV
ncbi:MAG: putative competence-damage inducible protein [Calditrichaeota bacterium]|nr:putative competence-damage inducible protein [Calditrichota bacterium]